MLLSSLMWWWQIIPGSKQFQCCRCQVTQQSYFLFIIKIISVAGCVGDVFSSLWNFPRFETDDPSSFSEARHWLKSIVSVQSYANFCIATDSKILSPWNLKYFLCCRKRGKDKTGHSLNGSVLGYTDPAGEKLLPGNGLNTINRWWWHSFDNLTTHSSQLTV